MSDPRILRQLQDDLRNVAKELAVGTERAVVREDLSTTRHRVPSLLSQLRESVHNGSETGKCGRSSTPSSPGNEAAMDLLQAIEYRAVDLHIKALEATGGLGVEERIQAMVALAGRWTNAESVEVMLRYLRAWKRDIESLLDPPRRMEVTAACPACGVRVVEREVAGEVVRVPALMVDGVRGCSCAACGHVWPTGELQDLAAVLEQASEVEEAA